MEKPSLSGEGWGEVNNLLYKEPGYGRLHNVLGWAYMYHTNDARRAELHFAMSMRFAPDFHGHWLQAFLNT